MVESINTKAYTCAATRYGMDKNVGTADTKLRTILGAVLGTASIAILAGAFSLPTILSAVLGVVAIVLLGTAATGTCGLYTVIGVDTCSMDS